MVNKVSRIPIRGLIKNSSRALQIQNTVKDLANILRSNHKGNYNRLLNKLTIIGSNRLDIAIDFKQLIIRESLR
jgi:hypothetical protein